MKQETLEEIEIISKQRIHKYRPMSPHHTSFFIGFRYGAEWQQERSYSEGDMIAFLDWSKSTNQEKSEYELKCLLAGVAIDTKTLFNMWVTGHNFGAKWQAERMGLMEIELRHTKTLLASCEKALEDRDKQAERMYGEEEVYQLLYDLSGQVLNNKVSNPKLLEKWFEQFKKK